ncbi:MAG: hypothetical protein WC637_05480 [Victivallales bacterium]|jgi:hypothetical protein
MVLDAAEKPAPAQQAASQVSETAFETRCSEVIGNLRRIPINPAWLKMKTGADACNILKWNVDSVGVRLSLPAADRKEAVDLYMGLLELCDNSIYAPWTTTRSLGTTLLNLKTLPQEAMDAQRKLLEKWNYDCSAGTINMQLYLYTAGYLSSELWPDFKDSAVPVQTRDSIDFRGKTVRSRNAAEIKQFCRDRIYEIFRQFTVQNLVEHDLAYFQCDLDSVKLLADFSKDPEMRKRATMVMDYFMLNLATDWNQGYDAEPYFRFKHIGAALGDSVSPTEDFGWLYFGTPRLAPLAERCVPLLYCSPNGYRMPDVFRAISRDRDGIREKKESQFETGGVPYKVWKTFFHTPNYSLSSGVTEYEGKNGIKTGIFKEQRLVNLTWFSGRPGSRFFVFQENIGQPYFGKTEKNVLGQGENPYSQRFQAKRTVIGVYDVPESYPHYRQYTVYRRNDLALAQREENGWVFTHTGKMLFGFYSLMPTTWERNLQEKEIAGGIDVRWCESRKNAWVLETAEADRYPGDPAAQLAAFAADVLKNGVLETGRMKLSIPEFSYKSIHGDSLRIVFSGLGESVVGHHFINNIPVDYRTWKTLDSPWARQEFNSPIVTVNFAGSRLVYDFDKWTLEGERK